MFGSDWIKVGGDLDRLVDKVSDQVTTEIASEELEISNVDEDMINAKAQSLIDDGLVIDPAVKAELMQALAANPGALVDAVHERLADLYPDVGHVPEGAQERDQTLYEVLEPHHRPLRVFEEEGQTGVHFYNLNGTAVFAGPPLDPFGNEQPKLIKGQRLPLELVRAKQAHLLQTLRNQLEVLESTPNPSSKLQEQMENLRNEIEVKTAEFAA